MPVTILAQPQAVHPAYNPTVYFVNSALASQPGFRYIVQIFPSASNTLYREFKVAPRIVDGFGYVDISKVIQDRITPATPPFDSSSFEWYNGNSKVFNYDIKFGEEYVLSWIYSDYIFDAGNVAFTNLTLLPHGLSVGDQIIATNNVQNYGDNRDALNGYYTVTGVPNAWTIRTNLPWIGSNAATPGTIRYADNRKVRFTAQVSSSNRKAFDAAYSVKDFRTYDQDQILPTTVPCSASFLTDAPTADFEVRPFQHLTWPVFDNGTNNQRYIWYKTDDGSTYREEISGSALIKMVAVGPGNADPAIVGTGTAWSSIVQTAKWYDVFTTQTTTSSSLSSEVRRIYLDQDCCKNQVELAFLDRKGAYSSFAFCLNMFETDTANKTNYNREIGDRQGTNPFFYNTWDSGLTTFHVDTQKQFTLNTDWITDGMSVYFEQLMTSPEVYVKMVNSDNSSTWYRCVITNTTFETQRAKNKKLIRKTVNITLAINNSINI